MQSLAKSPLKSNGILDAFKQNQNQKLRNLSHFFGLPIAIPEQTEPEDLSLHSPRSRASELDDLEDAAALYLKAQGRNLSILNEKSKNA
jgi:hypothetical protein